MRVRYDNHVGRKGAPACTQRASRSASRSAERSLTAQTTSCSRLLLLLSLGSRRLHAGARVQFTAFLLLRLLDYSRPRDVWYKSLRAFNTSPPRNCFPLLRCSCSYGPASSVPSSPPWWQPTSNSMVTLVNSHTNATSKRWHSCEIDLRFALKSTPGWLCKTCSLDARAFLSTPQLAKPSWRQPRGKF